ncbi:MAG: hypothetical protein AB7T31_06395 [Gemmatimonadales bacterium]
MRIFSAVMATGLAAVGGGFTVFGGYDDSPGGQLLGIHGVQREKGRTPGVARA